MLCNCFDWWCNSFRIVRRVIDIVIIREVIVRMVGEICLCRFVNICYGRVF